jgi:hypothetical protein
MGVTVGGVMYIGSANMVEVDNTSFKDVSSVVSGGGLYVGGVVYGHIKDCVFINIIVINSGGFFFLLFFFFIYIILFYFFFECNYNINKIN